MSRTEKVLVSLGAFAIGLALLAWRGGQLADWADLAANPYHPSDEVLSPYAISKNPYSFKGRSGVLDTLHVPLVTPFGQSSVAIGYPGLQFEKMIDEQTATYSVLVGTEAVMPNGEIAVILPNNEPPDSSRLWRVYVIGTIEGVNGLGQTMNVPAVRFEGYYEGPLSASPPQPTYSAPLPPRPEPSTPPSTDSADAQPATAPSSPAAATKDAVVSADTGKESDVIQAIRKSCENGFADSCSDLAIRYDAGDGVHQDTQQAGELYRKACNLGQSFACSKLQVRDYH